jgi:hypothetical protein
MTDKDLSQKAATLEKELRQVLGAIKGGWHENGEPEFTQRFGVAYINHIENVLTLSKPCEHEFVPCDESGNKANTHLNKPLFAICHKCGYKP